MAKSKKPPKKIGGPYLAAAFFCETIVEDKKDSALSAIRIIDIMNIVIPPATPPEVLEQGILVPINGLVAFKTGGSPGEHTIRLVMQSPSGRLQEGPDQTLPFTPDAHGGANLRLNTMIAVKKGGLFWLHVFLDGKRVTRMPLLIVLRRDEPTLSLTSAKRSEK